MRIFTLPLRTMTAALICLSMVTTEYALGLSNQGARKELRLLAPGEPDMSGSFTHFNAERVMFPGGGPALRPS